MKSFGTVKPEEMTREQLLESLARANEALGYFFEGQKDVTRKSYAEMNRFCIKGSVLFTGSSLMELFPVGEYCMQAGITKPVYNRGVGGTNTDDFLKHIDTVLFDLAPAKIFINIGTNDILPRQDNTPWQSHLLRNYENILSQIRERLPRAEVFVMAYYPVNAELPSLSPWVREILATRTNGAIRETNEKLRLMAEKFGYRYIDANGGLTDEKGNLRAELTTDGIHMHAGGYKSVFQVLKEYI